MIPGKDANSNQPANNTSKTDVFQTPWMERNFFATPEKLLFIRDKASGSVTARIISQNFFQRLLPLEKKFTVEKETKFTDVSEDRFKKEKQELQKLLAKHASANDMLLQIEKDLKNHSHDEADNKAPLPDSEPGEPKKAQNPTLTPEEIEARKTTIQSLRDELDILMNKIRKQEIKPEFKSFERLKKSITTIKETANSAFSRINQLHLDAENPDISMTDLEKSANMLKAVKTEWSNSVASIKQTFVEGVSLKEEIDRLSSQIRSFSSQIQDQWNELIEELQEESVSQLASAKEVHMLKQKLSSVVATICQECKEQTAKTIDTSPAGLKQHLEATAPDFQENAKQQAHIDFRQHTLTARKEAWLSLNKAKKQLGNDFLKIAEWQNEVAKEQAIDESLAKLLSTPPTDEGYLGKIYSLITSPLSSMANPLKAILPASFFTHSSPLLVEKALFDEASVTYVDQAFHKMNGTIFNLLECIPDTNDEKKSFTKQHEHLLSRPNLMKSYFDTFISDLIEFSRTAMSDDVHNNEAITKFIASLQGQKEAFTVLLKNQQQHIHTFIRKAQDEHPTAFSDDTHPVIRQAAKTVSERFVPDTAVDMDIRSLSADWQNHRLSAAAPLKMLKNLEAFGRMQEEFLLISQKRKVEIEQLTGEEKAKALVLLESLIQTTNSLDSIPADGAVDEHMLMAYHGKLMHADSLFVPLLAVEKRKKELRAALNKEIDGFITELNGHDSALADIERYFSIDLKDVTELLKKKRKDILELKKKGLLPSTYMNYAPMSLLQNVYYYARSALSFDEINVNDLTPADLAIYIENIKAEISIQKEAIARTYISDAQTALKAYQDQSKELDTHIKTLTIAAPKKSIYGMSDQSQIPPNIDYSSEPKLQFYNSIDTETKQKAIQTNQKQTISAKPNLKFVLKQLQDDTQALKRLLDQSKKTTSLSLLVQIDKMDAYPVQQKLAKLAFIEILTTKMNAHTKVMTKSTDALTSLPRIQEEAVRLIDKTKQDLAAKLKSAHKAIRSHVELWEPIQKAGSDKFSTKKDLVVDSLTVSDLRSYSEMIDLAVKTGNDHNELINTTYAKANQALKLYLKKVYDARNLITSLDDRDQLISKSKLQYILDEVEKTKENYSGTSASSASDGWFATFVSFMTSSEESARGPQRNLTVLKLLDNFKKNIGESIAVIDKALLQINRTPEMTIPQQLEKTSNAQIIEELKERYNTNTKPLIQKVRDKLEIYKKDGNLLTILRRYVKPSSPIPHDIEKAVDAKLLELDRLEKGHESEDMLSAIFLGFNFALTDLDAGQMEKHDRKLNKLLSTLEEYFDDKFLITTICASQVNYERAKIVSKDYAAKLRKKGHVSDAYDFEEAIAKIEKEEKEWEKKVTSVGDLKTLDKALKMFVTQMKKALKDFDLNQIIQTPYDDQMKHLHDAKKGMSGIYNYITGPADKHQRIENINSDLLILKSKIKEKVDTSYEQHLKDLKALLVVTEDIFSEYDIRMGVTKEEVEWVIKDEYRKFSHYQREFDVNAGTFSFLHSQKRIEDMTFQEIADARLDEKHEESVKASNKTISSTFNFPLINKPISGFKGALESAENALVKLKNEGQIIYADKLDKVIKRVKIEHDACRKKVTKNEEQLKQLGGKLNEFKSTLESAEEDATGNVEYTAIQQLVRLKDSPLRDDLKKHLVKGIQKKISEQKAAIKKSDETLDKLVNLLGFPGSLRDTISDKLEQSRTDIEKAGRGLNVTNSGWFKNTTSNYSIGELSVDQLALVEQEVNNNIAVLDTVFETHFLQAIDEQVDDYETQLNAVKKLKLKWKNSYQVDSAKKLDKILAEKKGILTAFFSLTADKIPKSMEVFKEYFSLPGDKLPRKMELLQSLLRKLTSDLSTETAAIKKDKPETIGLLMQNPALTELEYIELRDALKDDMQKKLQAQDTELVNYKKKIGVINELIRKKIVGCPTLPESWKILVENVIKQKQKQLKDLAKGLPVSGRYQDLSWKSLEEMNKEQFLQYETLVNRLVTKQKDKSDVKTSVTDILEKTLRLEELEKYLTIFQNEVALLERSLKQPLNVEKKAILTAILASNKKLVFTAIEELKHINDASTLWNTLYQSQASLTRINDEKDGKQINIDPWAKIYEFEASKKGGAPEGTPFQDIIKTGFYISFRPKEIGVRADLNYKVESFDSFIEETVKFLNNFKRTFEAKKQSLIASATKNNPGLNKLLDLIGKHDEILDKIEELKKGFPTETDGIISFVEQGQIKKFDQLISYRNFINSTISQTADLMDACRDENFIYFEEMDFNADVHKDPVFHSVEMNYNVDEDEDSGIDIGQPEENAPNTSGKNKSNENINIFPSHSAKKGTTNASGSKSTTNSTTTVKNGNTNSPTGLSNHLGEVYSDSDSDEDIKIPVNITSPNTNSSPKHKSGMSNPLGDSSSEEEIKPPVNITSPKATNSNISPKSSMSNPLGDSSSDEDIKLPVNITSPQTTAWKDAEARNIDDSKKLMCELALKINNNALNNAVKNLVDTKQIDQTIKLLTSIKQLEIEILDNCEKIIVNSMGSNNIANEWRNQLTNLMNKIARIEDLQDVKKRLETILETSNKLAVEMVTINTTKLEITNSIDEACKAFTNINTFIQENFGISFRNIDLSTLKELKNTYWNHDKMLSSTMNVSGMSIRDLPVYKKHVDKTIEAFSKKIGHMEAKAAIVNYLELKTKIKSEIDLMIEANNFEQAFNLRNALEATEKKLQISAKDEHAIVNMFAFTRKFNHDIEILKAIFTEISQTNMLSPELSDQIITLPENSEEYRIVRRKFIKQLEEHAEKIRNAGENVCRLIETNYKNTVNKQQLALLVKEIEGLISEANNFHILSSEGKTLDTATKIEFLVHEKNTTAALNGAKARIYSIKNALKFLEDKDSSRVQQDAANAIQNLKKQVKTKAIKHYPYFNIDKITKSVNNIEISLAEFTKLDFSAQDFISVTNKLENEMQCFENTLEAIRIAKPMNPFEQLLAGENESGVLNPESRQIIIDKIITWGNKRLSDTILQIQTDYYPKAEGLPLKLKIKMEDVIDNKILDLKSLRKENTEDNQTSSSDSLKKWIESVKQTTGNATISLDQALYYNDPLKKLQKHTDLHISVNKLLVNLRENSNFALAADLYTAMQTADNENKALMENLDNMDLKTCWETFQATYLKLNKFKELAMGKKDEFKTIKEQIEYLKTFPNYLLLPDYIALLNEQATELKPK